MNRVSLYVTGGKDRQRFELVPPSSVANTADASGLPPVLGKLKHTLPFAFTGGKDRRRFELVPPTLPACHRFWAS